MPNMRLLLISNSRQYRQPYLGHAETAIIGALGEEIREVLFVPFAAITISYDSYVAKVRAAFDRLEINVTSLHEWKNPEKAITDSKAIIVGGGNTFNLLNELYERNLIELIRDRAGNGVPYIGWSAGANIASPTIKTTNDMPVVWPKGLGALNLIPFQINPHYTDRVPPEYSGETRAERLEEFTALNKYVYVVGLREGAMLEIQQRTIALKGSSTAKIFLYGREPDEYSAGATLDFLLADPIPIADKYAKTL